MSGLSAALDTLAGLYARYPTRLPLLVMVTALLFLFMAFCFEKRFSLAVFITGLLVAASAVIGLLFLHPAVLRF